MSLAACRSCHRWCQHPDLYLHSTATVFERQGNLTVNSLLKTHKTSSSLPGFDAAPLLAALRPLPEPLVLVAVLILLLRCCPVMLLMTAAGSSHLLATTDTFHGDMQASAASRALLSLWITIFDAIAASLGHKPGTAIQGRVNRSKGIWSKEDARPARGVIGARAAGTCPVSMARENCIMSSFPSWAAAQLQTVQ